MISDFFDKIPPCANHKISAMPSISTSFDLNTVEWRRITDAGCKEFLVDFEYSLLGYDFATGRLDMLLRYGKGGHCRRHRHIASTVTLVLEGEQILKEQQADGSISVPEALWPCMGGLKVLKP